jgi:predicted O-linked N-acetylglucosamine transferase (SPINDLY family)
MFGFFRKPAATAARKVLNVGGNSKDIEIPELYGGWQHVLLDIDPAAAPDVVCDARKLQTLPGGECDSVYCSHNLEHYFRHDVAKVLTGFLHVLKPDGFVYLRVPDMSELMREVVRNGLDIEDVLYESPAGPIAAIDVIYGLGSEIERSGQDFFAHKTGFTRKSLTAALRRAGFQYIFTRTGNLEITAIAFRNPPGAADASLIGLSDGFAAETSPQAVGSADPLSESANLRRRGNEHLAGGRLEEAETCYRQAVALDPRNAEAHLNLGFVLSERKQYDEAKRYLSEAIRIKPDLEDAHYILGTIAEERSDLVAAAEHFSKALGINPALEVACRDLCRVEFKRGQQASARQAIAKGLALNPGNADFHYYQGNLLLHEKQCENAIACYRKALTISPEYAEVHANMGKAFMELGDVEESIAWYRKALSLAPENLAIEAVSCLLFARSYDPTDTPASYLDEARRYGDLVGRKARPYATWPACAGREGKPLRVGLVSGDFLSHPVGYFLESILSHLNSEKVELVAYPTVSEEDELTARIKPCFTAWHPIHGLDDEAAARKIREDAIQVLVDLAGHTSHNRLPVFAWKPAPVQVSWLGYFATTGVPGMDYLLADRFSVPEKERAHFTEAIWYLPDTRLCFTIPATDGKPSVSLLPALRNSHITFGCYQNLSKLNERVLAAWGRIFQGLPEAGLRIQCKQLDSAAEREKLLQRLGKTGLDSRRVKLVGPVTREAYLASHAEVDILLDTFPYPGGTTTCEGLWMGVPTLTLSGNSLLSRQGASMMQCVGLADWIASDEDNYVNLAIAKASDIDSLMRLRATLREKALASPLFDARRFAANLEGALQGMWQSGTLAALI